MPPDSSAEPRTGIATTDSGPISVPAADERLTYWSPLRLPAFRRLWFGNVLSNIGGWMQTAGAGWVMTDLAPREHREMFVALLAVAGTCPVFLFGFLAGVLADRFDRRRHLIATQLWMMASAATLAVLAFTGRLDAWSLIALMFCVGIGNAMNGPVWHAVVPEMVGRRYLPGAVALNSAGFNFGRTIGPVIGQVLQGFAGTFALFAINAVTFGGVIFAVVTWKRPPEASAAQRREGFLAAFGSGIRFIRATPALWAIWARAVCFFIPSCAFATLLPLTGRDRLHLDAAEYGVLFSTFGVGAVLGTMLIPRLNAWLGPDRANLVAMLAVAFGMALSAMIANAVVVGLALALAGGCWMIVNANNNVATQHHLPSWVRARGMAVHQLVFFGSLAVGQAAWGVVASQVGTAWALASAALLLVALTALAAAIRLPSTAASANGD